MTLLLLVEGVDDEPSESSAVDPSADVFETPPPPRRFRRRVDEELAVEGDAVSSLKVTRMCCTDLAT